MPPPGITGSSPTVTLTSLIDNGDHLGVRPSLWDSAKVMIKPIRSAFVQIIPRARAPLHVPSNSDIETPGNGYISPNNMEDIAE